MGAFRLLLVTLHYMGLYVQLSVSTVRQTGHDQIQNHISGDGEYKHLRFSNAHGIVICNTTKLCTIVHCTRNSYLFLNSAIVSVCAYLKCNLFVKWHLGTRKEKDRSCINYNLFSYTLVLVSSTVSLMRWAGDWTSTDVPTEVLLVFSHDWSL